MHGIHHSQVREEMDSNWASGLTLWDRVHGTLRLNVPQAELRIGVPDHGRPADVPLPRALALPFRGPPPGWPPQPLSRRGISPWRAAPDELLA
jgi:hypothetical protein